jgi:hypothetical protein
MLKRCAFVISTTVGFAFTAQAQELQVQGNTSATILRVENTATVQEDRVGVRGLSLPAPYWGVGGVFEGGYTGVRGYGTMVGAGTRFGGLFSGSGGNGSNYGVYASASGGAFSWAGYFLGNVQVTGTFTSPSDAKLKVNLQDLPKGALARLMKLRPKSYRYRSAAFPKLNLPEGEQIGLVAQDVAELFPEMVHEAVVYDPDDKGKAPEKFLSLEYFKLVPVLIKAIQEQQAEIDVMKAEIEALERR